MLPVITRAAAQGDGKGEEKDSKINHKNDGRATVAASRFATFYRGAKCMQKGL